MTAIREIELTQPLEPVTGLAAFSGCMFVLRWHGRVVGRATVPTNGDVIDAARLTIAVVDALGYAALEHWVAERLGYDERRIAAGAPLTTAVAICSRERPDDLMRALEAVMALRHAPDEVFVIDNAPATDATRQLVERFSAVRYVHEPRRGLNVARNRALRVASSDIVAFTDDDAVPERDWLGALTTNFQDPRVFCATGLTLPLELATEAQELFEMYSTFVRGFRRRIFDGHRDNPLAVGQVGAGANMAVRRRAVLELGGFDERLDSGQPTRSGGDHEMFVRILRQGRCIAYDPAAVSWHRHRRTLPELRETIYGYGVGVYAMWTGLLVEHREVGVARLAWEWFRSSQLRAALGGTHSPALRDLARTELRGCLAGPRAWFAARRRHLQDA